MINKTNIDFFSADLTRNDLLSKLKHIDRKELLEQLKSFSLEYRDTLKLPTDKSLTFGVEIEFENYEFRKLKEFLRKKRYNNFFKSKSNLLDSKWEIKYEPTIENGGEIVSPVFMDTSTAWEELATVCQILREKGATIEESAAGHIHIGTQILNRETKTYLELVKLWTVYENIIYRFSYGEKLDMRRSGNEYARPIAGKIKKQINNFPTYEKIKLNELLFVLGTCCRHDGINLEYIFDENFKKLSLNNTIEIRCPNGSIEEIIWQNNINFFAKLLISISNGKIDGEYLDYLLQQKRIPISKYKEIYLDQAFELSDMIFNNNFDKFNFLVQYFKKNQIKEKKEKVKSFTKNKQYTK